MDVKQDSIFMSALRAFCKTIGGALGIIVGLFLLMFIANNLAKPEMISDKTQLIIAPDGDGNRELLSEGAPVILRINIHGVIGTQDLNAKTVQSQLLDSQEGMISEGRVQGVLLHIDSPGGAAVDSFDIYRKLMEYKQRYNVPIYAFVNGMCASGAMMIACSADQIFATPVSLIGSVGVRLGPYFNIAELMGQHGVKEMTFTRGKDKDMLSPFREWKPGEHDSINSYMDYNYDLFVNIVTGARPRMNRDKLVNQYGAQVYDPISAEAYGYIDAGNQSYEEVLQHLAQSAGITSEYQVFELKVVRPMLSNFIEGRSPLFSGKVKHELELPGGLPSELSGRLLYLYSPSLESASAP